MSICSLLRFGRVPATGGLPGARAAFAAADELLAGHLFGPSPASAEAKPEALGAGLDIEQRRAVEHVDVLDEQLATPALPCAQTGVPPTRA
jgi:hypothetical protein